MLRSPLARSPTDPGIPVSGIASLPTISHPCAAARWSHGCEEPNKGGRWLFLLPETPREKEPSPDGRSQGLELRKPKRRQSGEISMMPATGSSISSRLSAL